MTIGMADRELQPGEENPDFRVSAAKSGASTVLISVFKLLADCRDKIERALNITGLELSMGMSGDFEEAIKAGSTNIRVGR